MLLSLTIQSGQINSSISDLLIPRSSTVAEEAVVGRFGRLLRQEDGAAGWRRVLGPAERSHRNIDEVGEGRKVERRSAELSSRQFAQPKYRHHHLHRDANMQSTRTPNGYHKAWM